MTLIFAAIGTAGFIAIAARFATKHPHKETSPVSAK